VKTAFTVIALILGTAVTVPALEQAPAPGAEKDLCLLDSRSCPTPYDLTEKVARLRGALEAGNRFYTPEELKSLAKKLEDSLEIADLLDVPETIIPR